MTSIDIAPASVTDLASALRRRETSALRLTEHALERIRELNPVLNAFALVDRDGALRAARSADEELAAGIDRGVLHGIPVAVKDLVDIAGQPTTCGSASSFGRVATRDAEVVTRLRAQGAVIVGKTVLHEFAYGATGDRSVHGASRNPRDPGRMSGGSSGGSAVAVAAGMVPLSVGTDTAGSVRVPAALCGAVGFKPAYGALPDEGVYPLAPTLDHVGLFATTVDDAWLAYLALAGPDTGRSRPYRSPKVGWIRPGVIATTDPGVEAVCHDVLVRAGLAPTTVAALPGWHPEQDLFQVFSTLQGREAFEVHQHHFDDDRHLVDSEVAARLERGRDVTTAAYEAADATRHALRASVTQLLHDYDVLALPTVPLVAPKVDERRVRVGGSDLEVRSALLSLTSPWNMARVPALSVPAGVVDGLPVGVQLIVAAGDEHLLFHTARAVESATTAQGARHY